MNKEPNLWAAAFVTFLIVIGFGVLGIYLTSPNRSAFVSGLFGSRGLGVLVIALITMVFPLIKVWRDRR